MTRKRFIKLMMGRGMQRNDAKILATGVYIWGSYKVLYQKHVALFSVRSAFSQLANYIEHGFLSLIEPFKELSKAIEEKDGASDA